MNVFLWSLKDERRWLVLWSAAAAAVIAFIIALYPAFGETVDTLVGKPEMLRIFMGRYADLMLERSVFDRWLGLEFFAQFGVLVGLYGLIFASSALAGQLERGTMELLLAQPVSRTRVLLESFAAVAVNLLVICVVSFGALLAAVAIWVDEPGSARTYACVLLNQYGLLLALAAVGFFCAVLVDSQRAALSLSIGVDLLVFVVYKALTVAGVALWLARLSPYYYADATKTLATGRAAWGDLLVLVVVAAAFLAGAVAVFRRKDIAV